VTKFAALLCLASNLLFRPASRNDRGHQVSDRRRTRFVPQLEGLDHRIVPSNNFTGTSGGLWTTAANWTDGMGSHHVPGTTEDVQVTSKTVDMTSAGSVTIGSLAMTGGTLTNASGGLTVSNGGGFSGSTINLNGGTFEVGGGTLSVSGSVSFAGLGSLFVVDSGATVSLGAAVEMYGDIENYGTIQTSSSAAAINFHVDDTHASNLYNDTDAQILFNNSCNINSNRSNTASDGGTKVTVTNNGLMRSQNTNLSPTVHIYGDVVNNGTYLIHDGDNFFEGTVSYTDYSFRNTGTLTLWTRAGTGAGATTSANFDNGGDVATTVGSPHSYQSMSLYNTGLFTIVNRDTSAANTAIVTGGVECNGGTIRFDATAGKVTVNHGGSNTTPSNGYGRTLYLHGGSHFEVTVNYDATSCDRWSGVYTDSYVSIKTGDSDVLKVTEIGTRASGTYHIIHTPGIIYGDFDSFDGTYWSTHHTAGTNDYDLNP
jgi:hypothetical protein